jgi:MFS family permease
MASLASTPRASHRRLFWIVVLLALSVLLNYVDRGAIGVAAPLMKQELGLSATGFGIAVSAFFWVYAPLCLVVGWLCDRFCVYRMFAAGIAIWALSTVFTGFVHSLGPLIGLRLMLGLGESIAFPGSSKIFAAEVPAGQRGMANAAIAAALAFGPAVGTLAGGTILQLGGWRPIFWIFGLVTLLWLLPWHYVSAPLRSPSLRTPVIAPTDLGKLLKVPALWLMGAAHFMSNYGFYFLLAWLPLYLVKTLGYSIAQMTMVTSLGFLAQGVSALVFGRLSDRWVQGGADEGLVRRNLLIAAQALAGLSIAGVWFAEAPWQVALSLILAGTGIGLIAANIFAVGQIFAGPRGAGSWIGVQNALGNCAGIIGPLITGVLVDRLDSYAWPFAIAAGFSALGAFWWWKVMPPVRPITI